MVYMTRQQIAGIAAQFGHRDLEVKQTKRGLWVATCSCGMRTTQRRTAALAAEAASHHLMKVIKVWESSGRPAIPLRQPISEGKGAIAPAAALRAS